jgi:hypothetical protein
MKASDEDSLLDHAKRAFKSVLGHGQDEESPKVDSKGKKKKPKVGSKKWLEAVTQEIQASADRAEQEKRIVQRQAAMPKQDEGLAQLRFIQEARDAKKRAAAAGVAPQPPQSGEENEGEKEPDATRSAEGAAGGSSSTSEAEGEEANYDELEQMLIYKITMEDESEKSQLLEAVTRSIEEAEAFLQSLAENSSETRTPERKDDGEKKKGEE